MSSTSSSPEETAHCALSGWKNGCDIGKLDYGADICSSSTRVNYASNLGLIHGLETMVCMAANGAMSVEGGNWQIFSHMLHSPSPSSLITTHLNTSVTHIQKNEDGTYTVSTSSPDTTSDETFDTIILASPYQYTNLTISPAPAHTPAKIPYVALHVTLFASPYELSPLAFNLPANKKVPTFVLTTLPEGEDTGSNPSGQGSAGFFSISRVSTDLNPSSTPPNREEHIYKIFSAEPVDAAFLERILGTPIAATSTPEKDNERIDVNPQHGPITWLHQKLWHSYPYEYPRVTFEEIQLDEGLWYTSGIESFISTMETSALMGKNVGRLVVDGWIRGKVKDYRDYYAEMEGVEGFGWDEL